MQVQWRVIRETFLRRKKRVALALLAVFLGASLVSALLTVYGDIGGKMSQEMRSYGANILVRPDSAGLELTIGGINYAPPTMRPLIDERDLSKIKTIFWKNNVTGIVPSLSAVALVNGQPTVITGTWFDKEVDIPLLAPMQFAGTASESTAERFVTGIKKTSPWWKIEGQWVNDNDEQAALVGATLARKFSLQPGDVFPVEYQGQTVELKTAGVVNTGSLEEDQVFVSLPVAQRLLGLSHGVDRVLVSALVTPAERLAMEIRDKDPKQMTPEEYELWYCTPLVESIAFQITEVVAGSRAGPVRQVSEAESSFVAKTQSLVLLVALAALAASSMGVMVTMSTMVTERRREIGLMKAIGAERSQIASLFLLEAGIIGLLGGVLGYGAGLGLAQIIGSQVFGASFSFSAMALPATLGLSLLVALAGSAFPIKQGTGTSPVALLREG